VNDGPALSPDASKCQVTIVNKRGLHARAAAKFAKTAAEFDAQVGVNRNGQTVSGKSIMGLMMLAASPGTEIEILADGPASEDALTALKALVQAGFDEED
jgi:phosphocarrier protein HPr